MNANEMIIRFQKYVLYEPDLLLNNKWICYWKGLLLQATRCLYYQ